MDADCDCGSGHIVTVVFGSELRSLKVQRPSKGSARTLIRPR
jgi:hypothetical protein